MRGILIFSLLIVYGFIYKSFSQGTWTQKANLPTAGRVTAVAFSIGNKGYMGVGFTPLAFLNDFWEYDALVDAWTQKANFSGGPRAYPVGFSIDNKGYIGTGLDNSGGNLHNDLWQYDPTTNIWTQVASFGGIPRSAACGFSVGGNGYIGTGYNTTALQDFWKYNPIGNSWSQVGNFVGTARSDIDRAFFVIGNNAYLGTGLAGNILYNDLWKYNPATDTWTQQANLPAPPRCGATGFSLCNKGFLGLGGGTPNFTTLFSDMWMYDPILNSWSAVASLPAMGRADQPAFTINNKAYIGTGYVKTSNFLNDFWEFTLGVNMIINASSTTICQGESTTLNASGALTYVWSVGGQTNNSIVVTPTITTTYSVTGTDSCGSSTSTVTVNVVFPMNINITGNTTICAGQTTSLTASGGNAYSWNTGITTATINISPVISTTYSVVVLIGSCSDTTSVLVTVLPPPNPTVTGNSAICLRDSATISASGGIGFLWNTGETTQAISMVPLSTTTYIVTVTDNNGCNADANYTVIVFPNPTAGTSGDITIFQGQTTTLSANGGATYLWGNGETTTAVVVAPAVKTVYCVTVTDTNNCKNTACVTVDVKSPCDTAGAFFFPNAFSPNWDGENDLLKIYYRNRDCIENLHLIIYDRWGEKVYETIDSNFQWDGKYNGKNLSTQVLVCYLSVRFTDGKEINRKRNISLVR